MLIPPPILVPAPPPAQFVTLGQSVQGRTISAVEAGDFTGRRKILIVGCVHGNEPAGIAIADALARRRVPPGVDLWIIRDLNPDGVAAGTRQNARGVDLNRNFPWRWRQLGSTGAPFYPGRRALSEPESKVVYRLINRLRPAVTIWFHQQARAVDESGGDLRVERRFARLVGLPLTRLVRYPGSAVSWQNHAMPGTTAFVVELPPGTLTPARVARFARAIDAVAAIPRPDR